MSSFTLQEKKAASKIAHWWKRRNMEQVYLSARKEFEEISKEIGDLHPSWGKEVNSLPQYETNDECEMSFAISALAARKATLKYDEFVALNRR